MDDKYIQALTPESILSEDVFNQLFNTVNEIEREQIHQKLQDRAKILNVKQKFDALYRSYYKVDREMKRTAIKAATTTSVNQMTTFDGPYPDMQCGSWIASETGIYAQTSGVMDTVACYHPILPIERLKNMETGEEQITLAFKRNNAWTKITVEKTLVASASRIVQLARLGVAVTSENAKLLVRYLCDVENMNSSCIKVRHSTSKLGWHGKLFVPFDDLGDDRIVFDGSSRFGQLFESITSHGEYEDWINEVKRIRERGRIEANFLLAASFASVLVEKLGALPFFVDLWGETEGGKTVALMLAASVWANPADNQYIGDFKSTDVALEAKADMLNNLPILLDDTSKVSKRIADNFEGVIYDLCSGKGKSRSNRDLGVNRENTWKTIFISNGERPLSSYAEQGGAINRILEIPCEANIFEDPQRTAETLKRHYGYAGNAFVIMLQNNEAMRKEARDLFKKFQKELMKEDRMQKQAISLSVVLTADALIEKYIFKDGIRISVNEAKNVLTSREEVSENERCYRYLRAKIDMNETTHFLEDCKLERWGIIEGDRAYLYPPVLTALCQGGGFSRDSFVAWAVRRGLIFQDKKGKNQIQKKVGGKNSRMYCIDISAAENAEIDNDGFKQMSIDDMDLPYDDVPDPDFM